MATKQELQRAREIVSKLSETQRKEFTDRFDKLDTSKKEVAVQRLLERAPQDTSGFGLEKAETIGPQPGRLERAGPTIGQVAGGLIGGALAAPGGPKAIAAGAAVGGTAGRSLVQLESEARGLPPSRIEQALALAGPLALPAISASKFGRLSPERRELLKREVANTAITEAVFAPVALATGQLRKFFPNITRAFGGVSKETVVQAKRIGLKRISDPLKSKPGFFTENLVPRVQSGVRKLLDNFTDNTGKFLKKIGVKDSSARVLKKEGQDELTRVSAKYRNNLGTMADRAKNGLRGNLTKAGDNFDVIFNRDTQGVVNVKNTFFRLKRNLIDIGAIDQRGIRLGGKFGNRTIDSLVNVFDDMQSSLKLEQQRGVTGVINKAQYNRWKLQLQGAKSGVDEVDRLIFDTTGSLRRDAAKSIPGLDKAFEDYSKAKGLFDNNSSKISEALLKRRDKWSLDTLRNMQAVDNSLPVENKFLGDLTKLNSAIDVFDTVNKQFGDAVAIESRLKRFGDFKSPAAGRLQEVREILSLLPDKEIADDALAHFLAVDLFQETIPTGFLGVAGASRKLTESITKAGISAAPFFESPITRGAETLIGRGIPTAISEAVSPIRQNRIEQAITQ